MIINITQIKKCVIIKIGDKMEKELDQLREEIEILNEKVKILENKERRRATLKYIKLLIFITIIGALVYFGWRAYDYVTNAIPNYIEEKTNEVKDSLKFW